MAVNLPYEVKRLIYNYVDIETLKSLRLVSASWAVVGLELLFLPCFTVKSFSIDIPRLISIGTSPIVSRQAARVIKKVKFYSTDWDAVYLRSVFCSRHSHLSHYEVIDFVPTQVEHEALEELDAIIARRRLDDERARDRNLLIHAFRQAPYADALEIISPNPFEHRILRKVWEEYNMETYRAAQLEHGSSQLVDILSAAKEAGLNIHHLGHDQLTSYYFTSEKDPMSRELYGYINGLKSLNFTICNREQDFPSNNNAILRLRNIIVSSPELESIYIKFELLGPLSLDFIPAIPPLPTKLHTLSLCGVAMDTARFIPFLESQTFCLRRLSITNAELVEGSWKMFLEEIREKFGSRLDNFQLAGVLKDIHQTWIMRPIYSADWSELDCLLRNKRRGKEIENFVLRAGDWPMTSEDDISSMLA